MAKYDVNGNGKIDVSERKPYVQALARQRREEAKAFDAQQPVLTPQEREFYRPPGLTPELIQQYDTNHDGKIDVNERLNIAEVTAEAARREFRRYDVNQDGKLDSTERLKVNQDAAEKARQESLKFDANHDGKLDREEMRAMQQAKQTERQHPPAARITTNSLPSSTARPPGKQ